MNGAVWGERTAICYPDGRRTAYEYNEAMQLSALKLLSDDAQGENNSL